MHGDHNRNDRFLRRGTPSPSDRFNGSLSVTQENRLDQPEPAGPVQAIASLCRIAAEHPLRPEFFWLKAAGDMRTVAAFDSGQGRNTRTVRSFEVTIDKSLRGKGRLARARNVLKREERMAALQADDRWTAGRSPLGLPKVRVMVSALGKKKKKKAKEEADTTAAAETATPAAGAKGAAPAAKSAGAAKPGAAKPPAGKK
jgi:small basic protein (TIGR04137 family)